MDFDLSGIIQQGLNLMPGSDGANPGVGMAGPAFLAALQQYKNAGQYQDTANKAAQDASPVSTTDRRYYIDRLNQSYKDPSFMLNDPGHAIQRARGLDEVASNDAMKGYMGSGNMAVDLSKYASESDQSFLEQERERMMKAGGFQFDPANAAAIRVKGDENSINAKNQALATMLAPFMANLSQNRINNGGGGGGGNPTATNGKSNSVSADFLKKINIASTPAEIKAEIESLQSQSGMSAQEIWDSLMNNPTLSPTARNIIGDMDLTGGALGGNQGPGFTTPPLGNEPVSGGGMPVGGGANPFDPNSGFWNTQPVGGGSAVPDVGESVSGNYDSNTFTNFLQDL